MKVKDLREKLSELPDNTVVFVEDEEGCCVMLDESRIRSTAVFLGEDMVKTRIVIL